MLSQWKREFVEHAAEVFDHKKGNEAKLKKELAESAKRGRTEPPARSIRAIGAQPESNLTR